MRDLAQRIIAETDTALALRDINGAPKAVLHIRPICNHIEQVKADKRRYTWEDNHPKASIRIASIKGLIANLREPKHIRQCLAEDSKRLLKQFIKGHIVGYH